MGFGKMLLELDPVDIRAVFSGVPAVAAGEEEVLLVRRDPGAVFNIG